MMNKQSEYSKKWMEDNLSKGLCSSCKEIRLPNSKIYCEKHYLQQKSKTHFKTTKLWAELLELYISQDKKCAMTGDDLILGLNDSLDHITPTSKTDSKYSKDMYNLRWVTRQVNTVKNDLSDFELIELLEKIKNNITESTKRKTLV